VEAEICKINETWEHILNTNAFVDQIPITLVKSPKKLGINTKRKDCDEYLGSLKAKGFIYHLKRPRNFKSSKGASVVKPLFAPPLVHRITQNMVKQGNVEISLPKEEVHLKKRDKPTPIYP
jgi:hypothetical protein